MDQFYCFTVPKSKSEQKSSQYTGSRITSINTFFLLHYPIDDNYIAFCTACGWVLYDLEERARFLGDLLHDIIVEIIPSDALIMDGLEDHPVLKEAQEISIQYETLP